MSLKVKMFSLLCGIILGFSQFGLAQTELIKDGSFELGSPNTYWNEGSTNFGFVICNAGTCGSVLPRTGSHAVWFGGIPAVEIGSVDQTVVIPPWGTSTLSFWLENPASSGSGNDYLQVQIDDVPVLTIYEGNPAYANYAKVSLDLTSYADGFAHKIEFYSVCYGSGTTNFFVDDVSVMTPPPVPISWISILLVFMAIGAFIVFRFTKNRTLILKK